MSEKNESPTTVTTSAAVLEIPREMIVADDDFNARINLDGANASKEHEGNTFAELVKQLHEEGQLVPVIVANVADHPGKYYLVAGFRRFAALCGTEKAGGLDRPTIKAVMYGDGTGASDLKDLYLANLAENEARAPLTAYERSVRYHLLKTEYDLKGASIARKVGLHVTYVNRLIKAQEDLCDELLERWAEESSAGYDGDCFMTTDNINFFMAIPKAKQSEALEATINPPADPGDDDDGGSDDDTDDDKKAKVKAKKTSLATIKAAIAAAKLTIKTDGEDVFYAGVLKGLEFAVKPKAIDGVLKIRDGQVVPLAKPEDQAEA